MVFILKPFPSFRKRGRDIKGVKRVSEQQVLSIAQIRDLPEGTTFWGRFVVTGVTQKMDKNQKAYWEAAVMDGEGTLEAKIWGTGEWYDRQSEEVEMQRRDPLKDGFFSQIKGCTVGVQGKVGFYKGQPQFSFTKVYLLNQEKYPPHVYVRKSPIPFVDLEQRFRALLDATEAPVKPFLEHVFQGARWKKFSTYPAAITHHHAYVHGLLEHTLAVASSALAIAEDYLRRSFRIDRSMVLGGALLHDIGKIEAYDLTPVPVLTLPGSIHDHIALGYATFSRLAQEVQLESSVALHLGHILLSHHGTKEFGSPVLPATPEALVVATADELDFRLFVYDTTVRAMGEGVGISDYHQATGRRFWKWQ